MAIVLTMSAFMGYQAQNRSTQKTTDDSLSQRAVDEPDRDEAIKSRLSILFAGEGLPLSQSSSLQKSGDYREAKIHWQNAEDSSSGLVSAEQRRGALRLEAHSVKRGGLQRQRSFELSSEQIVVIAVDANGEIRWWHTQTDPRLVRAEARGETGDILSRNLYLVSVDFSIDYPDDPSVQSLRFYSPIWTGREFHLQLIDSLSVADQDAAGAPKIQ